VLLVDVAEEFLYRFDPITSRMYNRDLHLQMDYSQVDVGQLHFWATKSGVVSFTVIFPLTVNSCPTGLKMHARAFCAEIPSSSRFMQSFHFDVHSSFRTSHGSLQIFHFSVLEPFRSSRDLFHLYPLILGHFQEVRGD